MPNKDDLTAGLQDAASAGLIDATQIDGLAAYLAGRASAAQPAPALEPPAASPVTAHIPGEEDLHFIRNFHDVFLATGIVLLSIGVAIAVSTWSFTSGLGLYGFPLAFAGAAGVMWFLAETFARRRRLFLPSIAICISFTLFVTVAVVFAYATMASGLPMSFDRLFDDIGERIRPLGTVAAVGALGAALGFYARFRLPFSMGLAGGIAVCTLLAAAAWLTPFAFSALYAPLILLGGLGLFAAGVWFDMRDPSRATRLSDNGFWLHMAAAPMILNGALMLVGGGIAAFRGDHGPSLTSAIVTLAVVAVLGLTSLLINRRALIVSALLTTGIAVGILMNAVGMDAGSLAASTLVTLGAGVLILGASWHNARRALLKKLPVDGIWTRIFPPEPPATETPTNAATKSEMTA
ncbi:MAG: hypothetical protein ABWZ40_04825 [Caulobacterales bacterium]